MLELTITILGIIFLIKILLPQILELIEAVLPQIHRIVVKFRDILRDIK